MPQLKRMTCLSYLKDGQRITTQPDEDTEHLTLQEELYEDSDCEGQDGQGYEHETQFQKFLRSSYATGMIYTILLIFVGGSLIALISVISQVVLPFWTVHGYCNTTCVPWELIVEEGKTCMCGVGCTAQYRWVTMNVRDSIFTKSINSESISFYLKSKHTAIKNLRATKFN